MSGRRDKFTAREVLDLLDENYGIPFDGEGSDISSEHSEPDVDVEQADFDSELGEISENIDVLDNLHAVEIADEEEIVSDGTDIQSPRGRIPSYYDFSKTTWKLEKNSDHDESDEEMEAVEEPEARRGDFRQQVGAVNILQSAASALEFFLLMFSMNIVNDIVCETNKYAFLCLKSAGKEPNLFERVTDIELLAYFGLCIAMSMHPVHSIRDYWSRNWILGVPSLARIMTVARFETITRYLHLNDNENMPARGTPGFDKLFKVRPFLESIRANFLSQYVPHKEVAIDEAMIKFKGRSSLKQYMPMKPIKRGIKMWCRADSINGYLNDFEIYTGKSGEGVTQDLGYSVVTKLCSVLYGKWHEVYFDNFFTSLELLQTLFCNKTLSCGTLRSGRRGFPKEMYDKKENNKLERGTCVFRRKGPITAVTWMDNKPVNVVCTLKVVSGEATKPVKRRKKDGEQQDVNCPLMISSYNKYMGGVDRNDQMKSYYAIKFISRKWWHRVFFELLDRCIVNGHILESESPNHEQRSLKDFRLELAKKLIEDFTSRKRPGRPSLELAARFTERHFPSYLPTNE